MITSQSARSLWSYSIVLSQSQESWLLGCSVSTNFDDAPTDVVSLLLCDWLQHATTLYEESKKLTCQFFVVASCRSHIVLVTTALVRRCYLSVRLSVAKMQKKRDFFSEKLSNLELGLWSPLATYIGSRTWAFQRTHYWTPKIQDGWDPPS